MSKKFFLKKSYAEAVKGKIYTMYIIQRNSSI